MIELKGIVYEADRDGDGDGEVNEGSSRGQWRRPTSSEERCFLEARLRQRRVDDSAQRSTTPGRGALLRTPSG